MFDENLSCRLAPALQAHFPGRLPVALLGLEQARDLEVWPFAKEQGYALGSKDDDLRDLQAVRGFPPKVVPLALGNCTNQEVVRVLSDAAEEIRQALADENTGRVETF